MGKFRFAQVPERVSTKSFVALIIGNSKSNHLGAQGTFKRLFAGNLYRLYEQALVSLKLKKTVDAEVGRTFAVRIEGG